MSLSYLGPTPTPPLGRDACQLISSYLRRATMIRIQGSIASSIPYITRGQRPLSRTYVEEGA